MKHTELRAAVLDALEKHDTGATLFDGRPAVFDEADFPAIVISGLGVVCRLPLTVVAERGV
ncbi:phage tail terminator protein, partial [Escherichia coli]|uniref:phage tail terminator protein n=1 Tax=Escherichia coli TaxID=562 RepID=UPI003D354BBF